MYVKLGRSLQRRILNECVWIHVSDNICTEVKYEGIQDSSVAKIFTISIYKNHNSLIMLGLLKSKNMYKTPMAGKIQNF
jgi:hypothetical protein